MQTRIMLVVASVLLIAGAPAWGGPVLLDAFNRPDDTNMGSLWTEQLGDFRIEQERATASVVSLMTYNDVTNQLQAGDTVKAMIQHSGVASLQYAGIVLGFSDMSDYVLVKIQDNGIGQFHRILFEDATGAAWPGMPEPYYEFIDADDHFTEAWVSARILGDTITIDLETNAAAPGSPLLSFSRSGLPAGLGVGIGLAARGDATIDEIQLIPIPEPATLVFLASGGVLALLSRRRRRVCG